MSGKGVKKKEVIEEVYTVREAAEKTKLSIAWWRQQVFQKSVRYIKIGRRVLIPKSTVEALFVDGNVEPEDKSRIGKYVTSEVKGKQGPRQGRIICENPLLIQGMSGDIYECYGKVVEIDNPPEEGEEE